MDDPAGMDGLTGKRALVTGAAGGIGGAIVARFRQSGALVAAADRAAAGGIESEAVLVGDLTDPSYCDDLPRAAAHALGGLDIVVNNAGFMARGSATEASDEDFRRSMAINVEAPFRICRAAIPIMAAVGGGAVVNMASCWGVHPGPDHLIYCTTKGALATMTQCLGRDHAHQNIRVNAVCPNEVNTPMLRTGFERRGLDPDAALDLLNKTVPLGRVAEPEEIADVVAFLASGRARYVCGALVEVNGGKAPG